MLTCNEVGCALPVMLKKDRCAQHEVSALEARVAELENALKTIKIGEYGHEGVALAAEQNLERAERAEAALHKEQERGVALANAVRGLKGNAPYYDPCGRQRVGYEITSDSMDALRAALAAWKEGGET